MITVRALVLIGGLALIGCKSSNDNPGDGGAGGAGGAKPGCPSDPNDLISDFTFDNSIAAVDGRQGGWYTYGDSLGAFAPASPGYSVDQRVGNDNCSGVGALHVTATGFADWGAALGVDFKPRPPDGDGGYMPKMTYDASRYRGVAFWAKASAALDGVQVSFPDIFTDGAAPPHDMADPLDSFNMCTACACQYQPGTWWNCSPYLVQFGKKGDAAATVVFSKYMDTQIDTTWKRFEILFDDARQDPGNAGYHGPVDKVEKSQITAMALQVNANYDTMPKSARDFEIWIDDVYFVK